MGYSKGSLLMKAVWVVSIVGDEGCYWANQGAIEVWDNPISAWKAAVDIAMELAKEHGSDTWEVEEDLIRLDRAEITVKPMDVQ